MHICTFGIRVTIVLRDEFLSWKVLRNAKSMGTAALKENAEALVAAIREIGLEVNADKTKYMVMSRDQNAGRIYSVRIDNSTFERVEDILKQL